MWGHEMYVREKLKELDELRERRRGEGGPAPRGGMGVIVGALARRAGRALRRVGEALESWGGKVAARPASPRVRPRH